MTDPIESLLEQLTLEEEISLLAGADTWHTAPIKRLGIPSLKMTDGPLGARGVDDPSGPTSACFPCGVALAATWDPELVERVGKALGEETQSKGAHILLAPTVNIHRSPLAGRNFECYSEDPYLTARMAVAYIRGLQSRGVGACIKHFVCNDSEFERRSMSSAVDERALREIYLRPFEIAVREARPWAVMSSYNRVNGVYASENAHTLLDILKGEWNFDGIVMSDWFGTYSTGILNGGLDLEMPGPARWMGDKALQAVRRGEVSEKQIDDKVRRLLRTLSRAGLFEDDEARREQADDKPEHRRVARQAAGEAIVLLKNDRSVLPLGHGVKSLAVIGEPAVRPSIMGGGSVRVNPHYVSTPLEAIRARVGQDIQVGYAIGCEMHRQLPLFDKTWLEDGLTLTYFANRGLAGEPVRTDKTGKLELIWFGNNMPQIEPSNFSVRLTGRFKVPESGRYTFGLSSAGKSRLFVDGSQVVDRWDDLAKTKEQNTGKIDLVDGQPYQLTVEYATEPGPLWRNLRIAGALETPADSVQQAVALAARSDVAIVFAGLGAEWESEGFDRPDMALPSAQARLIEQVASANANTVVVLSAGSPVEMEWLDRVTAVLQAWYLGQETGNAIADVLFGDVNPSGKLPTTFPRRLQDTPAFLNYPGENGQVLYGEGLYVGYRYYDKKEIEPLFPFGFGLSYTTFEYRNLRLSQSEYAADEAIHLSVEVANTGIRPGQEIVQVYVRDVKSRLARPDKELKAFARVALAPGERKTVSFALDKHALSYYDPAVARWVAEPGEFQVLIGASSRDVRLTASLNYRVESTSGVDLRTGQSLRALLDDARTRIVLDKFIAPLLALYPIESLASQSLDQLAALYPDVLTRDALAAIAAGLAEI